MRASFCARIMGGGVMAGKATGAGNCAVDAVGRGAVLPAAGGDELLGFGRHVVGIDLVAEQQQRIRPFLWREVAHPQAVRAKGIDVLGSSTEAAS